MHDWDGWIDPENYKYMTEWEDAYKPCSHEWYAIELISSVVYNCKKCGMKKEDYEKKRSST